MSHVTGPFEAKVVAQKPDNPPAEKAKIDRRSLDKKFHGALEAESQGEMLGAMTEIPGSGGYVAVERVAGTLDGKSGSFLLQHSSTMTRGVPKQHIFVIPDSGTGELTGLTGSMTIRIESGGAHFYEFEYSFE